MRVRVLSVFVAVLVLVAAVSAARAEGGLAIGGVMPKKEAKLTGVDGSKVSLAEIAGKAGTLVVFTCNACPYAKAWEQRIVELGNTFKDREIGVVAINSNDPAIVPDDGIAGMKERSGKLNMQFPYVVDEGGDVARAFGATRTPEAFLFDAQGKLVYHGTIDDNHQEPEKVSKRYLKDALTAVAKGTPVPLSETKAIGCGIKFKKA